MWWVGRQAALWHLPLKASTPIICAVVGADGASRPVKESKTPSSFVSVLSIVGRVYLVSIVVVVFPCLLFQRICHCPFYALFSSTIESIEVFVWVAAETVDNCTKAFDLGISCFSMLHLAGS